MSTLTNLVKELVLEKKKGATAKVCGICTENHPTDTCPTLFEGEVEDVNAVGFQGQGGPRNYDPSSKTYNPGWRDHPNFRWGGQNQQSQGDSSNQGQRYQRPPYNNPPEQRDQSGPSPSELLNSLAKSVTAMQGNLVSFQDETKKSIKNLENQVGQISTAVSHVEGWDAARLPSQTEQNPKHN